MVSLHASAKHGKTIYRRQQRRKRATVVRTHTRGTRQLRLCARGGWKAMQKRHCREWRLLAVAHSRAVVPVGRGATPIGVALSLAILIRWLLAAIASSAKPSTRPSVAGLDPGSNPAMTRGYESLLLSIDISTWINDRHPD
jgi:hypothetical protein